MSNNSSACTPPLRATAPSGSSGPSPRTGPPYVYKYTYPLYT